MIVFLKLWVINEGEFWFDNVGILLVSVGNACRLLRVDVVPRV